MVYQNFLHAFSNIFKIFDTEYDPSSNSKLSFHVGADILNLL